MFNKVLTYLLKTHYVVIACFLCRCWNKYTTTPDCRPRIDIILRLYIQLKILLNGHR